MKKREGKLLWACRWFSGEYYLHSGVNECFWHKGETRYTSREWPGPALKHGEGPVRVRVTIKLERSQR